MKKVYIRRLLSILSVLAIFITVSSINVDAYACPTHSKIFKHAMKILENDQKQDVYKFFQNSPYFNSILVGTIQPDIDESNPGAHYYLYSNTSSDNGKYFKNSKDSYSRSARTAFEEHYSTAINMYFSEDQKRSFNSLGKAIHYLSDISCTAHSTNMNYSIFDNKNPHKAYEDYITKNSDKFIATTAVDKYDYVINNPFSVVLNDLCEQSSKYELEAYSNNPELYDISIENTVPIAEKLTAALLNKFYNDINSSSETPSYLVDGKIYYIKNVNSSMYMTISNKSLVQDYFCGSDCQKFELHKRFDGSFTFRPISSRSMVLGVKWNLKLFRFTDIKLSGYLFKNLSNYFKPVLCENGYFRIMTGFSKYTESLNVRESSKEQNTAVYSTVFNPDNMDSYWEFEEC